MPLSDISRWGNPCGQIAVSDLVSALKMVCPICGTGQQIGHTVEHIDMYDGGPTRRSQIGRPVSNPDLSTPPYEDSASSDGFRSGWKPCGFQ
jgi:hypothetical protein